MAIIDTRRASVGEVARPPREAERGGLPGHINEERLAIGFVPSINTSAFAAPGRGLQAIGNAIGNLGQDLSNHNDKTNHYNDALKHAEFRNKTAMDFLNFKQDYNGSPDGAGFTKGWSELFKARQQEFIGSLSEKGREKYAAPVEDFRGGLSRKAATHEYDRRGKYQSQTLNSAMLINERTLIENPTAENIETSKVGMADLVNSMNIPDYQKVAQIKMINRRFDVLGAMGLAKAGKHAEARELFDSVKKEMLTEIDLSGGQKNEKAIAAQLEKATGIKKRDDGKLVDSRNWLVDEKDPRVKKYYKMRDDLAAKKGASLTDDKVLDQVVTKVIGYESGGNPNIKNRMGSSALGLGQFIKSTWLRMMKQYQPDLIKGKSRAQVLDMRRNPELSRWMTKRYAKENMDYLKSRGIEATPGRIYAAHQLGATRAAQIIKNPRLRFRDVMSAEAYRQNPNLHNKNGGQYMAWAERKFGGKSTAAVVAAGKQQISYNKSTMKVIDTVETYLQNKLEEHQAAVVHDAMTGQPALIQQQLIDKIGEQLRTDPENPALQHQLKVAEKFKKNFDAGVRNDPLEIGEKHGIAEVKPLIQEGIAPLKSFAERRVAANKIAERLQIKPTFLRADEAAQFKARFMEMESSDQLSQLAAFDEGFGADAGKVISEFSKQDVGFAHIGGLYIQGRRDVAARALAGMKAMNDKANKLMVESLSKIDSRAAVQSVFGNAFPNLDAGLHKGFLAAGQALAFEALMTGKATTPDEALKMGLKEAAGEKIIDTGVFSSEQWGGLSDYNGQRYLVPTDMKVVDVEEVFDYLTETEDGTDLFLRTGGILPTNPDTREPVTAEEMDGAKFVSIGNGLYKIVLDDGMVLRNSTPQTIDKNGVEFYGNYVFDLRKAMTHLEDVAKQNAKSRADSIGKMLRD